MKPAAATAEDIDPHLPKLPPIACGCDPFALEGEEARAAWRAWLRIGLGAVLAGWAMTLSLALQSSPASERAWLSVQWGLLAMTAVVAALLAPTLAREAWARARERRLTIEALFISGLAGAFGASVLGLATFGETYFETVAIVLVVYALGREVGLASRRRALRAVEAWEGMPAECDVLDEEGGARPLAVEQVRPGMRVRVQPGRVVPVDGTIEEGRAFVREAHLTGEPLTEARAPGEQVWAGTIVVDAGLVVRATAAGDARRIDRIAQAVARARAVPSAMQTEADKLIAWFLPAVAVIATATLAGWTIAAGWETGFTNALAVLLVACPCAMGFATPVAVAGAAARLAELGVVLRGGDAIEKLAGADLAVFDKTGTLTSSRPRLAGVAWNVRHPLPPGKLAALTAAVEAACDHPVAAALRGVAPIIGSRVEGLELLPGVGVSAQAAVEGERPLHRVRIGAERWGDHAAWDGMAQRLGDIGAGRRVWIEVDGAAAGVAAIGEEVLAGTTAALAEARALGMEVLVLTGDSEARAAALGVTFEAGLQPEEKAARVRALRAADRKVLFVGDGVNDAPALATADVAVAVGECSALTAGSADALLVAGAGPEAVTAAVRVAREARRAIRKNLRMAAGYNGLGIALASAGLLHPVAAALLMMGSSAVVVWRALKVMEQ